MARRLKVIVVEDDQLLCRLFAETLDKDPLIQTGQANDLEEALRLCTLEPQVVLLVDLSIPGAKGVEVVSETRKAAPGATIIVITGTDHYDKDAIKAGATAVIHKGTQDSIGNQLIKTIRDAVTKHEMELLFANVNELAAQQAQKIESLSVEVKGSVSLGKPGC